MAVYTAAPHLLSPSHTFVSGTIWTVKCQTAATHFGGINRQEVLYLNYISSFRVSSISKGKNKKNKNKKHLWSILPSVLPVGHGFGAAARIPACSLKKDGYPDGAACPDKQAKPEDRGAKWLIVQQLCLIGKAAHLG